MGGGHRDRHLEEHVSLASGFMLARRNEPGGPGGFEPALIPLPHGAAEPPSVAFFGRARFGRTAPTVYDDLIRQLREIHTKATKGA